jgi:MFS family permease
MTYMALSYPDYMTNEVKTRLSNSILIGDIFGMLIFGLCIDKFGRRMGIILTTIFLVLVSLPLSGYLTKI